MKMGIRRGGLFLLVAALGLVTVLGGCAKDKARADAATAEAAELRAQNAQLQQANNDSAARLAELEARQNAVPDESTPATTHAHHASNTGEKSMFSRSSETGLLGAEISGDVLFGSGSDVIKPEAKKVLDKVAGEIKAHYSEDSIRIEGYTDSDPLVKTKAKWGTNENLSQARAESVRKYLVSKGIKAGQIEAAGYGAAKPKATKAASRRVEIIVIQ
jgi:outer membrane protein OmpA-like peptidoglycan-associated protein